MAGRGQPDEDEAVIEALPLPAAGAGKVNDMPPLPVPTSLRTKWRCAASASKRDQRSVAVAVS